ncbi:MAG: (2Fe-2S)-binding protein [Alphaproteobacteria bacterium]
MFRRLEGEGQPITVFVQGRPVLVREGDTAATAALLAGLASVRSTPVSGRPRAPYCMMGVCFDCLMEIDGVGSRQACLETVREGMRIEPQRGRRALTP